MGAVAGVIHPNRYQFVPKVTSMINIMGHRGHLRHFSSHLNVEIGLIDGVFIESKKKEVCIALNGEISNLPELATLLHQKADQDEHTLLLTAYEHFGCSFVKHLRGKFVLVIIDYKKEKLFISRDRIGRTPLYWYAKEGRMLFASELKALLKSHLVPQMPAVDAIASYFFFGYIPQDMSPIEGVAKLLPGHTLTYDFQGNIQITPYWSYSEHFLHLQENSEETIDKTLALLIEESVQERLPKNKNAGCLLSGGLGSSSMCAFLTKYTTPIGLSVNFEGKNDDDLFAAVQTAEELKIPHFHKSVKRKAFFDHLPMIQWYLDEPCADPNIVAIWELGKLAKKHTSIVYSGMGCDELLAGHSRYTKEERAVPLLTSLKTALTYPLFKMLLALTQPFSRSLSLFWLKQLKEPLNSIAYLDDCALFSEETMKRALPRIAHFFSPEIFLQKFHHFNRIKPGVASYLYFDVKTRLPDNYILQVDRCTGAHALDWRTPFLDQKIVEYLATVPEPEVLLPKEVAIHLKNIMRGTLSDTILNRPKVSRSYFLNDWIRHPDHRNIFTALLNGALVETGIVSQTWMKKAYTSFDSSPKIAYQFFAILQLEIWFRLFIHAPIRDTPDLVTTEEFLKL